MTSSKLPRCPCRLWMRAGLQRTPDPGGYLQVARTAEVALDHRHTVDGPSVGTEWERAVPRKSRLVVVAPVVGEAAGAERNDEFEVAAPAEHTLDECRVAGHTPLANGNGPCQVMAPADSRQKCS